MNISWVNVTSAHETAHLAGADEREAKRYGAAVEERYADWYGRTRAWDERQWQLHREWQLTSPEIFEILAPHRGIKAERDRRAVAGSAQPTADEWRAHAAALRIRRERKARRR